MRKPDAFKQIVDKAHRREHNWLGDDCLAFTRALLRHQHAKIRAMVKRQYSKTFSTTHPGNRNMAFDQGYQWACKDLLAALAKMKKGKP